MAHWDQMGPSDTHTRQTFSATYYVHTMKSIIKEHAHIDFSDLFSILPSDFKLAHLINLKNISSLLFYSVLLSYLPILPNWLLSFDHSYGHFLPAHLLDFSKSSNLCNNYVPQWWVEFDDELSWLFTNRLRYLQKINFHVSGRT